MKPKTQLGLLCLPPAHGLGELGPCCACGAEDETVRNLVGMPFRAQVEGTGWGCFVCGLPMDGATAVICDSCISHERAPIFVVDGWPLDRGRVRIDHLDRVLFEHDMAVHLQDERRRAASHN